MPPVCQRSDFTTAVTVLLECHLRMRTTIFTIGDHPITWEIRVSQSLLANRSIRQFSHGSRSQSQKNTHSATKFHLQFAMPGNKRGVRQLKDSRTRSDRMKRAFQHGTTRGIFTCREWCTARGLTHANRDSNPKRMRLPLGCHHHHPLMLDLQETFDLVSVLLDERFGYSSTRYPDDTEGSMLNGVGPISR